MLIQNVRPGIIPADQLSMILASFVRILTLTVNDWKAHALERNWLSKLGEFVLENKTRQEAVARGELYFFTGKCCKRGHLAKRYVGNGGCYECLHPPTRVITGEIVPSSTETAIAPAPQVDSIRLALIERKLSIEERKLALKELRSEDRALRLQDRQERKERQYRQSVKRSRLVNVCCCIYPSDYETVLAILTAYAIARDPLLRAEDLVTARQMEDGIRRIMLCFPEDKEEILKVTQEMYQSHFPKPAPLAENIAKILTAEDGEWPADDPR